MTIKPRIYTEAEVQDLLKIQRDQIEAVHFEEKTEEVLHEINHRLDESNNYKATIGADVTEIKGDVKELKVRVNTIESDRRKEAEAEVTAKENRKQWWKDWWWRVGIAGTLIWEAINLWQSDGGSIHGVLHHLGLG